MNETLDYLSLFARFPFALRRFLSRPTTLDDARRVVSDRLARREENFLAVVEQAVYGNPRSPYLALLRHAGCERGDLQALIKRDGIEASLCKLREQGVYVTFEELRGLTPIIRNGLTVPVAASDFDNPLARRDFSMTTGGSSGLAMAVHQNMDSLADETPFRRLMLEAHGLSGAPIVLWSHVLPGASLRGVLMYAQMRQPIDKWFMPRRWRDSKHWIKYGLASVYMIECLKAAGCPVPFPQVVAFDRADIVARHLHALVKSHPACLFFSGVSTALRVALAAQELGLDLGGCRFLVTGEPLSEAKAAQICQSGARVIGAYAAVEVGMLGYGCAHPADVTDVHLQRDTLGFFTYPHRIQLTKATVPAFNITTLLPTTSKILINAQIGDYGHVEERSCGCEFDRVGYTTHIRHIQSYSKLVSEGVTLVDGAVVSILETTLPARFGGSPLDYQLLEEEDTRGFTRLYLVISPKLEILDEPEVLRVFYRALSESAPGDAARAIWQAAGTIEIKRREPIVTATGKHLSLYVERRAHERT